MASEELFKDIPPFPEDVPTASMSTISLKSLRSGEQGAAKDVLEACQELGFFLLDLRGDDAGKTLTQEIDHLFGLCKDLMNIFKPLGQAKTETNVPDRYESFVIGQDGVMGNQPLQELPPAVHPHLPIIKSYLKHCKDIVALINSTLATQLGLPADTFTSLQSPTQLSGTIIRLLKALASPEAEDLRTALIHHTDFGTVTLLANIVGGLQILSPGKSPMDESAWLWVKPQPDCLIVNLGDAMVQWTGGKLRSNVHRVRHAPGDQRFVDKYSVVYLARPERNASMKRLIDADGLDDDDEEDGNLTAWEWEVKKAMAMARPDFVSKSKGGKQ
ncbi:Clavaminate synthase-like protein [Hypoxylon sp. FL1857]|nr:Clavaminate synthase-like protein [Hypoxylon sp. FL1857]